MKLNNLLDKNHKSDPLPLDEGPWTKCGKLKLNLNGTILEWKENWPKPKKLVQNENSWFEKPRCKLKFKASQNWGFNLLQKGPNWFLGIRTLDPMFKEWWIQNRYVNYLKFKVRDSAINQQYNKGCVKLWPCHLH